MSTCLELAFFWFLLRLKFSLLTQFHPLNPTRDDITAPGDHEFNTRTYVRDTVCDVCCEALFGLAQQGMRCRRCKANIHHYCLADAPAVCQYRGAMAHDALPQWPPPRRSEVAEEA